MRYLLTLLILSFVILISGCTKEQGCTNIQACNFSQSAEEDDGSCYLPGDECDDGNSLTINEAWSNSCSCEPVFSACGDLVAHESYNYSTVEIGDQCWFAENCRYLPEVLPTSASSTYFPYYYVYGYEGTNVAAAKATDNYETYGVLYNWPAVMTEGICPSGWHIPSDEEFTQLTDFLGGQGVAGGKMKEAGDDHWNSPNTGATNSSGFTALPGGYCYFGGFISYGNVAYWWSSSEIGYYSWGRFLSLNGGSVVRNNYDRYSGFSARCVLD